VLPSVYIEINAAFFIIFIQLIRVTTTCQVNVVVYRLVQTPGFVITQTRNEGLRLDLNSKMENNNYTGETKSETRNIRIDQTTHRTTSVMLMESYFDYVYAKTLFEMKGLVIQKGESACEKHHPTPTYRECKCCLELFFQEMLNYVGE